MPWACGLWNTRVTTGGEPVTWCTRARFYTKAKWPNLAPVSCRSLAKALVTVAVALGWKEYGVPEAG